MISPSRRLRWRAEAINPPPGWLRAGMGLSRHHPARPISGISRGAIMRKQGRPQEGRQSHLSPSFRPFWTQVENQRGDAFAWEWLVGTLKPEAAPKRCGRKLILDKGRPRPLPDGEGEASWRGETARQDSLDFPAQAIQAGW